MSSAVPSATLLLPFSARVFVSLSAVVIVFLVFNSGWGLVDDAGFFLLLSIIVVGAAWLAGTGTALMATVLGAVLGGIDAATSSASTRAIHVALFLALGLLLTALVTELRRARRTAEQQARAATAARLEGEAAARTKDEFLATISHELRTPLNAVLGWVQLIRAGALDAPTRQRGLDALERNVRLQAQLTSDLLDMSKALTGRLRLESQPIGLERLVDEAVVSVLGTAAAKDVRVEVGAPNGAVRVRGDAHRLRQAIWHLLANAIKFTPNGGQVDISVHRTTDRARVAVRDSGPGIAPEFLPRLFDRFTQADPSPTRRAGGLGVGLAVVREIVERHGGEVHARNRGGGGAVFEMALPLYAGSAPAEAVRTLESAPPLNGVRVLLVDRSEDARDLLTLALRQRGAAVRAEASVGDALEALEAWHPDVLVSDSVSPEHDSYALVAKIRSLDVEHGGRIPAMALTSFAHRDARTRALLSPVQRELPKPVEPGVLLGEIAKLAGCERRRVPR